MTPETLKTKTPMPGDQLPARLETPIGHGNVLQWYKKGKTCSALQQIHHDYEQAAEKEADSSDLKVTSFSHVVKLTTEDKKACIMKCLYKGELTVGSPPWLAVHFRKKECRPILGTFLWNSWQGKASGSYWPSGQDEMDPKGSKLWHRGKTIPPILEWFH